MSTVLEKSLSEWIERDNIQFQHNLARIPIAAAILVSTDSRYETLLPFAPTMLRWLPLPLRRELVRIYSDGRIERV